MSEKRLLKHVNRYESLLRTWTELSELSAERVLREAEAKADAEERRIRRAQAERNFAALDRTTVYQTLLTDRIAREDKQYLDLRLGALKAGRALTGE